MGEKSVYQRKELWNYKTITRTIKRTREKENFKIRLRFRKNKLDNLFWNFFSEVTYL